MDCFVLKVEISFQGNNDFIYPVLLKNARELILVDCGYSGFMPLIEAAANLHGLSLSNLTGIIITHDDIDHVGGLFEIKSKYPALKLYASDIEEPYISGIKKSLRLQQAEALLHTLPEDKKAGALKFQEMLRSIQRTAVDYTFSNGKDAAFLEDVNIINTPGHTPGHISIYLKHSQTLIAADAIVVENDELEIANPNFTLDLEKAVESVKKLQQLKIDKLICYHGGIVENDIGKKLEKLISKYADNQY